MENVTATTHAMNEQNAKQEQSFPIKLDGVQIWREADDLIIMHLPGLGGEDIRLSESAVIRMLDDLRRITPASTPADAPTDATGEAGEGPTPETDAIWVKLMAALGKAGLHPSEANDAFGLLDPIRCMERTIDTLRDECARLRGVVESAVADFRKLKPFMGDAADATADLYQTYIK